MYFYIRVHNYRVLLFKFKFIVEIYLRYKWWLKLPSTFRERDLFASSEETTTTFTKNKQEASGGKLKPKTQTSVDNPNVTNKNKQNYWYDI